MRWTSDFFIAETTTAEIAVSPFFCSAALRAILPSRPHWQWNGTAFLPRTCRQPRLWLLGAGDLVAKRNPSAASVTGLPILSCRTEAPAPRFLGAAASITTRIVRSFAPPGRQSTSRGRAAP
ncbi:hypothetical protein M2199_009382 [Bradyrhizobium elkanii]|nr:hypothetical protein [Bradyrhizobium elkanii]MCS4085016.1 hypothetical protein [Bradyrhizobium elkanii]MCS4112694.1 hypothetical protein [Bradyrhizobium elkanii]MCW2175738.1 hypothetical protein [Bradyrhizobium elkanii]